MQSKPPPRDLNLADASSPYAALSVDTSLFPAAFQARVLSELSQHFSDGLDAHLNGTLIHADNFQALNLLQARYREQVKCIYIDPPYNTGLENDFIYKDNYQHSSWATLMSNRFELAKKLMLDTAGIWVSTDDGEYASLKLLMDENFGNQNFVADVIWNSRKSVSNDALISGAINHTTFFSKNKILLEAHKHMFRLPESTEGFSNPDNDPRGLWKLDPMDAAEIRENLSYGITNPKTREIFYPPEGRHWRFEEQDALNYLKDGRILFGKTGKGRPAFKRFYEDAKEKGKTTKTLWDDVGTTTNGTQTLYDLFQNSVPKDKLNKIKPKPHSFMEKIFQLHRADNSVYMDYFAGSGTTAHAIINLNREDGGNRKYILVEQGEYFDTVLKPRVQKVIYAENWKDGKPMPSEKNSRSADANLPLSDGIDSETASYALHTPHNGVSQIVKVLRLESYEDCLNNLALHNPNGDLFATLPEQARRDYVLRYMLDVESRGSLLNVAHFERPFDYVMEIAADSAGASVPTRVDLVETFNYLLGLSVVSIDDRRFDRGYVLVAGQQPNHAADETTLILWRDCVRWPDDKLTELLEKLAINPQENEFAAVYVNGDHTLTTAWSNADGESGRLKIRQTEAAFLDLMFEGNV